LKSDKNEIENIKISFGYSSSEKHKSAVRLAQKEKNYASFFKNAKEIHSVKRSISLLYKDPSNILKLIKIVRNWASCEILIRGQKINGKDYFNLISSIECFSKKRGLLHCTKVHESSYLNHRYPNTGHRTGWGCAFINSILLEYSEKTFDFSPGRGKYWFEFGEFKNNKWVVDKDTIRSRIKLEIAEKKIANCPSFDMSKVEDNIRKLPDEFSIGKDFFFWDPIINVKYLTPVQGTFISPSKYCDDVIRSREDFIGNRDKFTALRGQEQKKLESKELRDSLLLESFINKVVEKSKKSKHSSACLISFLNMIESPVDPFVAINKFTKADYNYSGVLRNKQEMYYQELIIFLIWHSFERYRPKFVLSVFEKNYQCAKGDIFDHYGWVGGHSRDWRGRTISENKGSLLQSLVLAVADYFLLNSDFEMLEKFLVKYRRNLDHNQIEAYSFMISVELKREPDYRLLAVILLGNYNRDISKLISMAYAYNVTEIERSYLRKVKKPLISSSLIDLFCDIFPKSQNEWFLQRYLDCEPKGVLRNKERELFELTHNELAFPFPSYHPYGKLGVPSDSEGFGGRYKRSVKEVEIALILRNYIRNELGLPNVSEGWVGEASLLMKLKEWFPKEKIVHQWSPAWLGRQRIDIGFPKKNVAIEYHGTQHFKAVDFFGGEQAFRDQKRRDLLKASLCKSNNVRLLVFTENNLDLEIRKAVAKAIGSSS
jgi:hypothetical protein